ncbi:MAG TPA: alpha/beta hydrolase [Casimicrobiaceae bacterium]|nr:alpha/beta hydrolase [Casimicrobiaceae bacterium]
MRFDVGGHTVYAYTGTRPFDRRRPTVVFVHGAANDHGVFALQSRYFAWHGSNAVAVDLPGHGRSAGIALTSVEALAVWLRDVVDALDVREASLVGHSMGALAALECAARHPHRVARLALLGPSAPMPVSADLLDAAAANDHVAYELINGWSFAPASQLAGGNRLPGVWMLGNAMRLMERTPEGVLAIDLAACNAYANGVEAARRVRCPTLVILAARDIMAPLRNAKALVDALADVCTVTLPDTGHSMMAERPDEVLDALRNFLPVSAAT